jgi:hypothetical protein
MRAEVKHSGGWRRVVTDDKLLERIYLLTDELERRIREGADGWKGP